MVPHYLKQRLFRLEECIGVLQNELGARQVNSRFGKMIDRP